MTFRTGALSACALLAALVAAPAPSAAASFDQKLAAVLDMTDPADPLGAGAELRPLADAARPNLDLAAAAPEPAAWAVIIGCAALAGAHLRARRRRRGWALPAFALRRPRSGETPRR